MEILSAGGVCCASMAALTGAWRAVALQQRKNAVVVGSELVSRSLKATRFRRESDQPVENAHLDGMQGSYRDFDADFLRWMLSDGGGQRRARRRAPRRQAVFAHRVDRAEILRQRIRDLHVHGHCAQGLSARWQYLARPRIDRRGRPGRTHAHPAGHGTASANRQGRRRGVPPAHRTRAHRAGGARSFSLPLQLAFLQNRDRQVPRRGRALHSGREMVYESVHEGKHRRRQHLHHAGGGVEWRALQAGRKDPADGARVGAIYGVVRIADLCRPRRTDPIQDRSLPVACDQFAPG